ncbi:MAG: RND family efflux transporter MFP subunit [Parcubacteria group bacterium Gr01-1014_106]|nr:MAG: RND family efflux transporter MFP subunit [Parcubacteria group bacterium Gr01-1014_106]
MPFLPRSRRFWIAAALVGAAVGASVIGVLRSREEQPETVRVTRRDLTQDVIITGRAEAAHSIALQLDAGGTIARIAVSVGDRVEKGDFLAALDTGGLSAELARASAIRVATLFDARLKLSHADQDTHDVQAEQTALLEQRRQAVRDAKVERDQSEDVRQHVIAERGDQSSEAKNALLALRRAESAYHAAQRTLAATQASALHAQNAAASVREQAHADLLEVTQAAPDTAGLSALDADVALARFRFRNAELRAPIAGTITAVNGDVGERVPATTPLIVLETVESLELVADVPETDIAKLSVGQSARVTFDAVKDIDGLEAMITRIHPSAVLIEGVPTFRVITTLAATEPRLRPGMTADIRAITGTREQVLALPTRALTTRDGATVVTIRLPDGRTEEQHIATGLRSSDGFVEITDGLAEGDTVLLPVQPSTRTR